MRLLPKGLCMRTITLLCVAFPVVSFCIPAAMGGCPVIKSFLSPVCYTRISVPAGWRQGALQAFVGPLLTTPNWLKGWAGYFWNLSQRISGVNSTSPGECLAAAWSELYIRKALWYSLRVSAMEGKKLKFTHVLLPGSTAQQNQCHNWLKVVNSMYFVLFFVQKLWLFFSCIWKKKPMENDFVGLWSVTHL